MAQTYIADVPDGTTNILQDNINGRNNENTLRSSFSGTAFPDTPVAGQHCYRTDTGIEYIYDGTAWIEVAATNTLGLDVAAAKGTLSNLSSRLNVSINPDGTLKDPTTANVDEFKVSNVTPTYVDATTFSVPDDLTGIFTAGRIIKITDGAEVKYLSVVSSAFDTVTNVVIDGTITASISAVDYSLAQYGLPLASATVKGVVKVGTNLSATNGVISVADASNTVKGGIVLATDAGVITGTDTERAVTPAGLLAGFSTPLRANLLGTVSQTGGVPTGAVIESGSNANGSYVKFADGTMICTQYISFADNGLSFTKNTGSLNWWALKTLTFPAAFSASPKGLSASATNGTGLGWASVRSTNTTTIQISIYDDTNRSGQAITYSYTAIGRWF